jgi:hypothetical protein
MIQFIYFKFLYILNFYIGIIYTMKQIIIIIIIFIIFTLMYYIYNSKNSGEGWQNAEISSAAPGAAKPATTPPPPATTPPTPATTPPTPATTPPTPATTPATTPDAVTTDDKEVKKKGVIPNGKAQTISLNNLELQPFFTSIIEIRENIFSHNTISTYMTHILETTREQLKKIQYETDASTLLKDQSAKLKQKTATFSGLKTTEEITHFGTEIKDIISSSQNVVSLIKEYMRIYEETLTKDTTFLKNELKENELKIIDDIIDKIEKQLVNTLREETTIRGRIETALKKARIKDKTTCSWNSSSDITDYIFSSLPSDGDNIPLIHKKKDTGAFITLPERVNYVNVNLNIPYHTNYVAPIDNEQKCKFIYSNLKKIESNCKGDKMKAYLEAYETCQKDGFETSTSFTCSFKYPDGVEPKYGKFKVDRSKNTLEEINYSTTTTPTGSTTTTQPSITKPPHDYKKDYCDLLNHGYGIRGFVSQIIDKDSDIACLHHFDDIINICKKNNNGNRGASTKDKPFKDESSSPSDTDKLLAEIKNLSANLPQLGSRAPVSGADVPNTTLPNTTLPDTTLPDTTLPDTTLPDTTLPDTTLPDTTLPDTTLASTTLSGAALSGAALSGAALSGAALSDTPLGKTVLETESELESELESEIQIIYEGGPSCSELLNSIDETKRKILFIIRKIPEFRFITANEIDVDCGSVIIKIKPKQILNQLTISTLKSVLKKNPLIINNKSLTLIDITETKEDTNESNTNILNTSFYGTDFKTTLLEDYKLGEGPIKPYNLYNNTLTWNNKPSPNKKPKSYNIKYTDSNDFPFN